jgi:ribosome-associated protein
MKKENLNKLIIKSLEDSKGVDIVTLDVKKLMDIADTMIICTGTSNRHVNSLANNLLGTVKEAGYCVNRVEGAELGDWMVVDCGDTLVHLMQEGTREVYQLEKLWAPGSARPESDF